MKAQNIIIAVAIVVVVLIAGVSIVGITGYAYRASYYGHATWTCPDNARISESGCKTYNQWMSRARDVCNAHCVTDPNSGYRRCNAGNVQTTGIGCDMNMLRSLLNYRNQQVLQINR